MYSDLSIKTSIIEKFDNVESILLTDITDIFLHVEVYLSNYERDYSQNIENRIVQFLRYYSTDVSCLGLDSMLKVFLYESMKIIIQDTSITF